MAMSFCCLDRHLDKARRGVSVGGLGILAKHRKKQHLITLLDSLRTIKTLVRSCYTCILTLHIPGVVTTGFVTTLVSFVVLNLSPKHFWKSVQQLDFSTSRTRGDISDVLRKYFSESWSVNIRNYQPHSIYARFWHATFWSLRNARWQKYVCVVVVGTLSKKRALCYHWWFFPMIFLNFCFAAKNWCEIKGDVRGRALFIRFSTLSLIHSATNSIFSPFYYIYK